MSSGAVGWVFDNSPFTGASFTVHLALGDSANDMHEYEIWARQAWIADKARVGHQACNRAIAELVDGGYLAVLEDNARAGKPNRYKFIMPTRGVSPMTTPGVAGNDRGGVAVDDTQTEVTNPTGTLSPPKAGDEYSKAFLDMWLVYPRKIEKRAAWRAWKATVRRCGVQVKGDMVNAARNYARYCKGREEAHIKHAATFYGPSEPWKEFVTGVPAEGAVKNGRAPVAVGKLGSREDDL